MAVRDGDCAIHADTERARDLREFVGETDVHVSIGVLHQLAELGRHVVGADELAADEARIDGSRGLDGRVVEPADHAIVVDDFVEHVAR